MRVLFFLISFIFSFQFILSQELRVHLLDSSLNEVVLKNPKKISSEEKRKIYNYVEYYIDNNGEFDEVVNYYAYGKYPTDNDGLVKEAPIYRQIDFSKIENRKGALRSRVKYRNSIQAPLIWTNPVDTKNTMSISKYWPNGKLMHQKDFDEDGVELDGINYTYDSKGRIKIENHQIDGELKKFLNHRWSEGYLDEYIYTLKGVTRNVYTKSGDYLVLKVEYDDKINEIDKKYFSATGNEIFNVYDKSEFKEPAIKKYLDSKSNRSLEGIYTVKSTKSEINYKIFVAEMPDGNLTGLQLESYQYNYKNWSKGDTRAKFEETAVDGFYNITWYDDYRKQISDIVEAKAGGALMSFGDYNMIRLYPKVGSNSNSQPSNINIQPNQENWQGNGSGIILTKNGHIATNHHVIDGANYIEVEFKYKGEIKSFSAEVLRSDPVNDLAIIKINDSSFSGLSSILYNFKIRGSQIGEYVFALGYPKALTMMGSDIKFTDGRISSLNGAMGDVTNYQTSVPIQPGNSGGPLFDENGNLIGINVAKIVAEDVENVSYSVKTLYLLTLIDALPSEINLPSSRYLQGKPVTQQIKALEPYVVLIKVN